MHLDGLAEALPKAFHSVAHVWHAALHPIAALPLAEEALAAPLGHGRPGLLAGPDVHGDWPAVELRLVERGNGSFSLILCRVSHVGNASRSSRLVAVHGEDPRK